MGRPVAMNRRVLYSNRRVIGVGLGSGSYEEHMIYSLEDMKKWVGLFNDVQDIQSLQFICNISKAEAKKVIEGYKSDMKRLEKTANMCLKKYGKGGSDFYQLSSYLLRPSINMYSREVRICNTGIDFKPALYDGEYTLMNIAGPLDKGVYENFLKKRIGLKCVVSEDIIFNHRDYAHSLLHQVDFYMASWGVPWGNISIAINNGLEINRMLIGELRRGLRAGVLALLPYYGDYRFPCLVLLDVACLGCKLE